ncbi:hypothetical protein H8R29_23720 [Priestia megaterium]|uniref:Uncharacterized protein n=1 Tax=Priestia megaterium (strain ATCC 14581 / DSM 32 / CCUG 1817 / JCM 2506 / NBRC 15308 / NCIMB 9376 / NCTC 10342 / NRRL B-14308 / VKM B-512 / Ford 19) TaxID=1348623 RepID=A0A0B6AKI1_PRIM2|nr:MULTISPECIES: hypothetical protein [Priestia]AJI25390.1 hypothetical protein BG04_1474 [Priestia megaterium NBRC 15308 = ATCC 14581]KGJ84207.1 hypothetical protein BMT_13060 [Priestia megaterium NBRC 15308 = ATCC 14581]MDR4230425.1 hypothetical protein [Priestia megaterium]MED3805574.1 hypothetical protein [Priestia megaterium]MED3888180.1 hypothetical protein [Priestia aryabhattai]
MNAQALNICERARELEESGWAVIESIDLNADMEELQEEAFNTVLAAREIQKQSLSRVERIIVDMKSKGFDVDIVPRYLKQKEATSYV